MIKKILQNIMFYLFGEQQTKVQILETTIKVVEVPKIESLSYEYLKGLERFFDRISARKRDTRRFQKHIYSLQK